MDDIVFGVTNEALCKNFAEEMQDEFEMSMMCELKFFLGLQIKQNEDEIFISQEKYIQDMLKKVDMLKLKSIGTLMNPSTKLDVDEKGKGVDQKLYRDADFAGSKMDRKSTSGTCQFLGSMLVSWSTQISFKASENLVSHCWKTLYTKRCNSDGSLTVYGRWKQLRMSSSC
ncbi:Reverse transcriptase [Theobroma cacao]|nr:Reverse transcriptase [Theobroma cacao]